MKRKLTDEQVLFVWQHRPKPAKLKYINADKQEQTIEYMKKPVETWAMAELMQVTKACIRHIWNGAIYARLTGAKK